MQIYTDITKTVGHTPLVEVSRYAAAAGVQARLLVKLESRNPGGSAKDRIALSILNAAERSGALQPGGTIVEPTSGNTGIGLALVAAARGYQTVIVMPETMSTERRSLMRAYGAQLVLTPGSLGMKGAIRKAQEIAAETGAFLARQFENEANPAAHYTTTGPEIWQDTDGTVDIFVAGVGTGGTVTGVGRYLKEQNPAVQVVAVEPADSPVLSGGAAGPHGLQGIGAGFVPQVLDTEIYDEIIQVKTPQTYDTVHTLIAKEGILAGISSGAALYAATQLALRPENAGKVIVALLTDGGERYLSTPLFSE